MKLSGFWGENFIYYRHNNIFRDGIHYDMYNHKKAIPAYNIWLDANNSQSFSFFRIEQISKWITYALQEGIFE